MDSHMFDGLIYFGYVMIVVAVIFVPLGLWKLIEIIIWICHHVHFQIA